MELTLAKIDIPERVIKMLEAGETSARIGNALRIPDADALAMKKQWLDEKAPKKPAKKAKAEKEAE
jgi:hypothetical protein